MVRREINMTQGNPFRQMTAFALPVIAGGIMQQLYQVADTIIAGRLIGSGALAAVSNSSICVFLVVVLFMGVGNGASIVLSQLFGAGDKERIRIAVDTSTVFIFTGGVFCSAVSFAASSSILRFLGTPAEVFDDAILYLRIISVGLLPAFGYAVLAALLNAVGDSETPLKLLIITSILNVILDFAFVAWFGMGTGGLAVATVMAQTLSFVGCAFYLNKTQGAVTMRLRGLKFRGEMLWKIIRVGFPSGLQDALMMISILVLQTRINTFGVAVIAGRSIVGRIEGFLLLPIHGLGASITTYTGQNTGAGNEPRVKTGLRIGFWLMLAMSAVLSVATLATATPLLRMFTSDAETLSAAKTCIWITVPCYTTYALAVMWQSFFRGSGDTIFPLVVSLFTQFAYRILTIDTFLKVWPTPSGVWYAFASSWILMLLLDIIYYKTGLWRRFANKVAK